MKLILKNTSFEGSLLLKFKNLFHINKKVVDFFQLILTLGLWEKNYFQKIF